MATFSSVSRQHLLQAISEYDERGGEEFCELYGFTPAPEHTLVHEGRRYDAGALLGVAHRIATGRLASPDEVAHGLAGGLGILRKRGFEVSEPTRRVPSATRGGTRASSSRPRATRTPQASTREVPPAICPTCSMALPATGICDFCG
ncbi:hypothetical protein Q6346_12200 [Isoptericola sp. b490]|uniref:hypothetical protein n=1 Tax=Actinotalea lenta TaxID=3064654 RepID=UPI0027131350|nr:hypothetical protein [Isoptericola sp. b490]MDO8122072.1 hypothetical protein [Isoptericola sp. b490]